MVSRKSLAQEYQISIKTLAVWLKKVEGVVNITKRRKFTAREADQIRAHLGPP